MRREARWQPSIARPWATEGLGLVKQTACQQHQSIDADRYVDARSQQGRRIKMVEIRPPGGRLASVGLPPHQPVTQMRRAKTMAVACLLVGAFGQGDEGTKDQKGTGPPTVKEPALRQELLDRMKEEQKLRER